MKGMIRQELKNYFKNPLYWVGILFILYGLFQILSPYLDVHYFHSKQEVQQTKPESLADADIMDGYVKSTEKERIDLAAKKIQSMIVKEFGEDAENVRETLKEIRASGKSVSEMSDAIGEIYGYPKGYSFQYYYQVYEYHKGTKNEINKDLKEKLTAHSYSWYFGRKFADFGGLYLGFSVRCYLRSSLSGTRKETPTSCFIRNLSLPRLMYLGKRQAAFSPWRRLGFCLW